MVIDTHQHFWQYDPVVYNWINEDMEILRQNFMPEDLKKIYDQEGIDGCVAVQVMQSEAANDFMLGLASKYDFIKGVVGWVDLQDLNIEKRLRHYAGTKKLCGFRHIVQDEPDDDFMLRPAFQHGLSLLHQFGFSYDILIFPNQMKAALQTVERFPEQPFVIDHIAKPYIKAGKIKQWAADMRQFAQHSHVYCKLSGMITEANWQSWKKEDFFPYLDVVVETFGPSRLMYGSDWPVCLLAGNYSEMKEVIFSYLDQFSEEDRGLMLWKNAVTFYRL